MPSDSIAGFLDQAQANRVLIPEQVEQLIRQPDIPQTDLTALCEYLERRGALTRYQADMLRQGRGYELNFAGYPVLDEIGPCPGGVAYRALHPSLRTPLVLRRLRGDRLAPADNPGAFVHRARTASALTHPHAAAPLDAGFYRDEAYVTVDPDPGDSADLESLVGEIGPMPAFLAAEFGRQIASALRAAHERGLVHGEVRPANVVVGPLTAKAGPDGKTRRRPAGHAAAKLAGLGLTPVRPPADAAPPPADVAAYLPPERLTAAAPEPRGDLYGLGATLYYLLTTRAPYPGASADDILHRVRTGEPAPLSAIRPDAPPELVRLVNQLMDRRPESRTATAADAEEALAKFCRPGTAPHAALPAEPVAAAQPVDYEQSLVIEEAESAADWGVANEFSAAHAESAAAPPKPKKMITHAERMRLRMWLAVGTGLWLLAGVGWMYLAGCFNTAAPEPEPTPIKEKEEKKKKSKRTGPA